MILDIQKKINKLLYHYYTVVGVIQRDYKLDELDETMEIMLKELETTYAEINEILNKKIAGENEIEEEIADLNVNEITTETSNYIKSGNNFIEFILKELEETR